MTVWTKQNSHYYSCELNRTES